MCLYCSLSNHTLNIKWLLRRKINRGALFSFTQLKFLKGEREDTGEKRRRKRGERDEEREEEDEEE